MLPARPPADSTTAVVESAVLCVLRLTSPVLPVLAEPVPVSVAHMADGVESVLVTGSSSGFGRVTAEVLARSGRQVFATMRDVDGRNADAADALQGWAVREGAALARVLGQLTDALAPDVKDGARAERRAHLSEARLEHGGFDVPESQSDAAAALPQRIIKEIHEAIDDDAIITCDAGENRIFMTHYFQSKGAGTFIQPAAIGGMGYAIPAALAAKLVSPDRQAVAVCGDGGFAMGLNGLMSARENKLPITVVVFNNQALGWVINSQGDRVIASEFEDFDHAAR